MTLSPSRVEIIEAMDRLWREHPQWRWPTLRELADATYRSPATVYEHLQGMIEDGLVQKSRHRGFELLPAADLERLGKQMPPAGRIPVAGRLRSDSGLVVKPYARSQQPRQEARRA